MGPDGPDKHRKGKIRISNGLALYLKHVYCTDSSSTAIDVTQDMLCTTCFNAETRSMNADTSWNTMDTDDSKPLTLRTAAVYAAARISGQIRMNHPNPDDAMQCNAPNEKDEEATLIETSEKRANATAVLNDVFDLLGEQRIDDARNQNILRARTSSALIAVRRLAENILDIGDREVQQDKQTSAYTVDEADEFLQGFKDLVISSDYSEQIRLFTLAPSDWEEANWNHSSNVRSVKLVMLFIYAIVVASFIARSIYVATCRSIPLSRNRSSTFIMTI